MRKFLFILCAICFCFSALKAQTGSRFPLSSTSVWRINHIRNGVSDENKHENGDDIFKYFINGDTLINSKTYFKIFKTGITYLEAPFYYENVYKGAIRDEDNKFYLIKSNETSEVLLYNFNAEVDDTIQVPYEGEFEAKVVSSVDTLPDGRKLIHFNPKEPIIGCGDAYIIEGIGGSGGLLEGPACNHAWTFDNHLVCYIIDDILIYHDAYFDFTCDIPDNNTIDSTCTWRVDKQIVTDTTSDFEKLSYFFCGDTIIESVPYLKLCKTGFQLYIATDGKYTAVYNNSVYTGALRETGKKIYFMSKNKSEEELLYNFNLLTGDTIDGLISCGDTIKAIDTILDKRIVFYLGDERWQNFIIEGIGSDKGLLENKSEGSTLICFTKNNAPIYHSGTGTECILTFDNINFMGCNIMNILPEEPSVNDEVKVFYRICYQVSHNHPDMPLLTGHNLSKDGNSVNLELYYTIDDQKNSDSLMVLIPLFDTLSIGKLIEGENYVTLIVHTIHKNGNNTDTTFYDKDLFVFLTVSPIDNIPVITANGEQFKVYPAPARDFLVIEAVDPSISICSVDIYTLLGAKVKTERIENRESKSKHQIDVGNLSRGIYFMRIHSENSFFTKEIILE